MWASKFLHHKNKGAWQKNYWALCHYQDSRTAYNVSLYCTSFAFILTKQYNTSSDLEVSCQFEWQHSNVCVSISQNTELPHYAILGSYNTTHMITFLVFTRLLCSANWFTGLPLFMALSLPHTFPLRNTSLHGVWRCMIASPTNVHPF